MDILCTRTGKIFYRIDPALAALLCEALPGSFEQVNEPAKPAQPAHPVPQWGIGTHHLTGELFVKLTFGARNETYTGHPKGLSTYFGIPVPEAVANEYGRRWQAPKNAEFPTEYYQMSRGAGEK